MVDVEQIKVMLPPELVERIDYIVDLLGFESREKFVEAAVRRLVDQYMLIVAR